MEANVNAVEAVTRSCLYYAVRVATDPSIPANGGCYRPLALRAPVGSIVNARPPAAVADEVENLLAQGDRGGAMALLEGMPEDQLTRDVRPVRADLLGHALDATLRGQRDHPRPLRVPLDDIQCADADGTGRSKYQGASPPRSPPGP